MADIFVNPSCGPKPQTSDFLKKGGGVKWKAYNKANRKWLACAKSTTNTAARQDPENVAARAESAGAIGTAIAGAAGQIGAAALGGGVTDLSGAQPEPPADQGFAQYLPYAAAAAVAYMLWGK